MNNNLKVSNICNYKELDKEINSNYINLSYVYMETIDDLKRKQIKRNGKINEVLGEKSENIENIGIDSTEYTMISPKYETLKLNKKTYNSEKELYDKVVNFLDTNTKKPINNNGLLNKNRINHKINKDPLINSRSLITKINMHNNLISMNSRIGPGSSIIVGRDNWVYFNIIESSYSFHKNFDISYDINIDPSKVIICRKGNINQTGIYMINDKLTKSYFFGSSKKWENNYSWFWIK